MKRTLMILSALSMAAVAGPFKLGANVDLGAVQPFVGSDAYGSGVSTDGSIGFGASIGPVAEYAITPMFGVLGGVSYAYQSWSSKGSVSGSGYTIAEKDAFSQSNLELSVGPTFHLNKISVGLGYRWSVPLAGSVKMTVDESVGTDSYSESKTYDIKWAGDSPDTSKADLLSTHNIYVNAGYEVIPHLTVGLGINIGLTGLSPKKNDAGTKYDGAASSSKNVSPNRRPSTSTLNRWPFLASTA